MQVKPCIYKLNTWINNRRKRETLTLNELIAEAAEYYGDCRIAFKRDEGSSVHEVEAIALRCNEEANGLVVLLGFPLVDPARDEDCGDC